jgi:hypothetical protein
MRHSGWSVIVSVVCLAVIGCTSQQTANKGDALVASGFKTVPANTPERQATLRQLPPQKFVRQVRGEKVVYVYADPANCNCLYVGSVTAYGAYRARATDRQVADEQDSTALQNWDWSPWAFGFPE